MFIERYQILKLNNQVSDYLIFFYFEYKCFVLYIYEKYVYDWRFCKKKTLAYIYFRIK